IALAAKLWPLRIFDDTDGRMNEPVARVGGYLLIVSQITLYGSTERGRRPSWGDAARPDHAEPLIEAVSYALPSTGATPPQRRLRADMAVELVNDGPVTLLVEV